ncbi:NAD(P)H-hydrate dehydratase [bacterium]|jgi:hydroxyethylthiazole kinase-like uncharacterized protein yjeF|nr:NAD(P)H-hydrate dehydratase [bacterium]
MWKDRIHKNLLKICQKFVRLRVRSVHKGTCGRVLVVAGSRDMIGAGILSAMACLKSGAGVVHLATVKDVVPYVSVSYPELIVHGMESDDGALTSTCFESIKILFERYNFDACAIGPGLTKSSSVSKLVHKLFSYVSEIQCPTVIDADALTFLSSFPEGILGDSTNCVLTPHVGEFSRLHQSTVKVDFLDKNDREKVAKNLASNINQVVVLKGPGTVVTDGRDVYENMTGNEGMATAGSGDVLTGIISSFLAQGLDCFDAACLGAYIHGLSGDHAFDINGIGLIASDILDKVPHSLKQLKDRHDNS